jgi:3-hydroxyisobutyrate dehydrogenase-like beta-hydroxyacid dehydrogenase
MALKLCNNLVTYIELSAALEAYRLAEALGLDHAQLTAVMTNNGNLTPSMRQFVAFRRSGAEQIGAAPFRASQEAVALLGEKDLALAHEAAEEAGATIPVADHVHAHFRRIIMEGLKP